MPEPVLQIHLEAVPMTGIQGDAMMWEREAAAGNTKAMFDLGLFAEEVGDLADARKWWKKAAGCGNAEAALKLEKL